MNNIELTLTSAAEDHQLVELVKEITVRLQAGEPCEIGAYAARFPEYADRLRDWMTVMSAMADLGHSLAVGAASRAAHPISTATQADGSAVGSHSATSLGLLGDFRITREIGRGGMGVVYEAEQISIGRRVALKVLPFAAMLDKQQLNRFKNEARAAGTLDHPNIVAIHSVGVERGVHYYAMQLIEGQSLAQVVEQVRAESKEQVGAASRAALSDDVDLTASSPARLAGPTADNAPIAALPTLHVEDSPWRAPSSTLPAYSSRDYFRTIAQLGIQAAEALDHAHQNGILHRDIKPANLLVECSQCSHHAPRDESSPPMRRNSNQHHAEREDYTLKLWITDFGLARMEQDAGMTMTGDILGTLRYMSPEQALAKRVVVDHRSDIYSLGVTLYELLTLHPAFPATDRQELLRQIAFDEPGKLRQINPRIPQDLETIVLKAIEKNPADRYSTSNELSKDLLRFVEDQPIKAKPPNLLSRTTKWSRRHRPVVITAVAVLLILTAGSIVSSALLFWERQRTTQAAAESKAVVDFLVNDLLGAAGNENELGREVTVKEVLGGAAAQVAKAFVDQPLIEAVVRDAIARSYFSLGNYDYAELHARRALEIRNQMLRPESREHIASLHTLASILVEQRKLSEARGLCTEALSITRRYFGVDHADTLTAMHKMAWLYLQYGHLSRADADVALRLCRDAVDTARRIHGPESIHAITAMEHLADLLAMRGEYDEASQLALKNLELGRRVFGPENPTTIDLMSHLAAMYELCNAVEALAQYQEVLNVHRRVAGDRSPKALQTARHIVKLKLRLGKTTEARELANEIIAICHEVFGPEHPQTLRTQSELARAMHGDSEAAEELHLKVISVQERVLGPNHQDTLATMFRLTDTYGRQSKYGPPWLQLIDEIIDRSYKSPNPPNPELLVWALLRSGEAQGAPDFETAIERFEEAIQVGDKYFWPQSITRRAVLRRLADVLGDHGKYYQAIQYYDKALQLDPDYTTVLINRGYTYFEIGDYGKAVADTERALTLVDRREMMPDEENAKKLALNNLASFLATADSARFRDGRRAVELATRLCELTNYSDPNHLSTLAKAYAETGDFESAVKWSEKSLELNADQAEYKKHLNSFKKRKPWRLRSKSPPTDPN